jgi:hypothetical protein
MRVLDEARPRSGRGQGPTVPGLALADDPVTPLDPFAPDVEPCHDATGDVLAYCRATNGSLRVDMPDLASFSYERGTSHVKVIPHRPLPPGLVLETYHHCVLPLILPALGIEVLHASAVGGAAGVAAFCAPSGTGKSTLAVALARRGYPIWADDAVAVDLGGHVPTAVPLPFTVRLHPDSARLLGSAGAGGTAPGTSPGYRRRTPLAVLCMLRRAPDATAPVELEQLEAAAASLAALGHAYCFSVKDAALKRRMIGSYLTIVGQVPAYEIRFRPGPEHLPAVLDAIEELLGCAAGERG